MIVTERFYLPPEFVAALRARPVRWGFGAFSEVVYYRTYSRTMDSGAQEAWADTIIRVVEGALSVRKNWYRTNGLAWDEDRWLQIAIDMAEAMFDMKMLPPGRGLWAMGTQHVYERGSGPLYNCGFVDVKSDLASAAAWAMDMLMLGVGVGFSTNNAALERPTRPGAQSSRYKISDDREGWVEATRKLIQSYYEHDSPTWEFDYSGIRPAGAPLKAFGGISSGPDPLIKLHNRIREFYDAAIFRRVNDTRLITDVMNAIGACVVSGNVRRSAQLATGSITDQTFLNLKNYSIHPTRADIGWMSNNSIVLEHSDEFEQLPAIAAGIRENGEPGVINMINVRKYGRVGKKMEDQAVGMNPCAEIPLEDRELCNVVEVFPTRCRDAQEIWRMMHLATIYAHTVSLLPCHDSTSNAVIARNRRIGVSVSGVADWIDGTNLSYVTMILRRGYEEVVEPVAAHLAAEAGVPRSVRLTTVKPSGTISQLAGVSPGMHWPVFKYGIRRIRVSTNSPIAGLLASANVPYEDDAYSDNTLCFSFPLKSGSARPVHEVSIWEQASLVAMLQREWADNAVSNTLTFTRDEEHQIEAVLAAFAPLTKSMSMLADASEAYAQPPYERVSESAFKELSSKVGRIEWAALNGSDGADPQFCGNEVCEIPQ